MPTRGSQAEKSRTSARGALTLVELVVVLVVIAALSSLVIVAVGGVTDQAREQTTQSTLRHLQEVILQRYSLDMAGVAPTASHPLIRRGLPGPFSGALVPASRAEAPQLVFLFVDPQTSTSTPNFDPLVQRGWRGPYLLQATGRYPGLDPDGDAVARGFSSQFGLANSAPGVNDGDPTVLDGWGNPIVIQTDASLQIAELVSAGPDGVLLTTTDNRTIPLSLP